MGQMPKRSKIKMLTIFNSWETKDEFYFFELGQKNPKAHLRLNAEFGWLLFNRKPIDVSEYEVALMTFLSENPQFREGQDFSPDEDENEGY